MIFRDRVFWLLLLIFIAAAGLRTHRIDGVWMTGHHGYNGAQAGLTGRNFVRFGPIDMKLGPALNTGPARPEEYHYVLSHPYLLHYSVAASFAIFGFSQWAASVVSILYSLGSLLLVFLICRRLWGDSVALLGTALMAGVPMDAYYGRVLIHEIPALFFSLLCFYMYLRWLQSRARRDQMFVVAAYLMAMLSGWAGYFAGPWLGLHYLLFAEKRERRLRFPLLVLSAALLTAFLQFAHVWWLAGSLDWLVERMVWRTGPSSGFEFTLGLWLERFLFRLLSTFTPIVVFLASALLIHLLWRILKRSKSKDFSFLLVFLGYGLTHIIVFRQDSWIHEYRLVYLTPFLVAAAALGFFALARRLSRAQASFFLALCLLLFAVQALPQLRAMWKGELGDPTLVDAMKELRESVDREARILSKFYVDLALLYYADRPFHLVSSREDLQELTESDGFYGGYLFAREGVTLSTMHGVPTPLVDAGTKQFLMNRFPVKRLNKDLLLFDLTGTAKEVTSDEIRDLLFPGLIEPRRDALDRAFDQENFGYLVELLSSLGTPGLEKLAPEEWTQFEQGCVRSGRSADCLAALDEATDSLKNKLSALAFRSVLLADLKREEASRMVRSLISEKLNRPAPIEFDNTVEFLGYQLEGGSEKPAHLTLAFQSLKPLDRDYAVWIHGYPEESLGMESTGPEILDTYPDWPTSQWIPGGCYLVAVPLPELTEPYRILFGIWANNPERRLFPPGSQTDVVELPDITDSEEPVPNYDSAPIR